ncbi:MAG: hypothetical protein ACRDQB_15360 [Thermocrispum sp.]
MNALVVSYVLYVVLATAMTMVVGLTLTRHGRVYLAEVFSHDVRVARSVNQLLVLGFYLVSFGFVALTLTTDNPVRGVAEIFELLSVKLGVVALGLGALHLANVALFNRIRRRYRAEAQQAIADAARALGDVRQADYRARTASLATPAS